MLRQRANPIIIERKLLGHSLLKLLNKTFTNYSIVKEYKHVYKNLTEMLQLQQSGEPQLLQAN